MIEINNALSPDDFTLARSLFIEYQKAINVDLCFQNFEKELANLATIYSPPTGGMKLFYNKSQLAGVVAVRSLESDICEMKRLYVRSQFRGHGYGRMLALEAIMLGHELGYKKMRLDTLPTMTEAIALYTSLGFRTVDSYRFNPDQGAIYMEIDL